MMSEQSLCVAELTRHTGSSRNDRVHYRLKNWGAFKRVNTACGPMESPMSSIWQGQITDDYPPVDLFEEYYIDNTDAEKVQKAMMMCMSCDKRVAMILVQHYHYRSGSASHLVHKARNKFWRYLC